MWKHVFVGHLSVVPLTIFAALQVFTTLVLTQDPLILMGNAVQGTLNSVLLWQTVTTAIDRTRRAKGSVDDTHAPYEEVRNYTNILIELGITSNSPGIIEGLLERVQCWSCPAARVQNSIKI